MMNDQTTALLTNRLQAPMIIRDLLESQEPLSGDMGYSLHELFSDMRPDSALLAIALSAKILVSALKKLSAGDAVLHGLSSRIIEDYAPRWLTTYDNDAAAQGFLMDVFGRVEADLISVHELLKTASAVQKDDKISGLLRVLEIQAKAQADISAEFLNLMECEFMQGEVLFRTSPVVFKEMDEEPYSDFDMDVSRYDTPKGSNVLSFPAGY